MQALPILHESSYPNHGVEIKFDPTRVTLDTVYGPDVICGKWVTLMMLGLQGCRDVGRQGDDLLDALVTLVITLNVSFKVQFVYVFATQTTCHFLPCNQ